MELTNQEIARVFAMYYGCEMVYPLMDKTGFDLKNIGKVTGGLIANNYYSVTNTRLLLTPLSKISDEDAIEVAKIYTSCRHFTYKGKDEWGAHIMVNAEGVTFSLFSDLSGSYGDESIDYYKKDFVIIYLISKGYAVPLFFAPNHPANGKTAIDLNIAIDKTCN